MSDMGDTWEPAWSLNWCRDGGQHSWLPTTGEGMQCFSCPMCEQLIYWSEINRKWVKVIPASEVRKTTESVANTKPVESKLRAPKTSNKDEQ